MQRERLYPVAIVVHRDRDARTAIVQSLRGASFQTVGVDTFETAKHLLALEPADVLVTEARLGDYHGLHLVLLARTANAAIFAVVITTDQDDVLQREVESAGATLLVGSASDLVVAHISRRTSLPRPGSVQ